MRECNAGIEAAGMQEWRMHWEGMENTGIAGMR
jgi:hypothetical protein